MIFLVNFFQVIWKQCWTKNTARAAAKTAAVNDANNDKRDLIKGISFRNNGPFTDCILKINNVLIYKAEGLDVAMSMYNLLDYSRN